MPHIHEKYDFIVSVYIVNSGKVLLVNHPRYNMWLPMGGHIELDEDPEEAIYREVEEETGLEVEILSHKPKIEQSGTKFIYPPRYIEVHDANPPHKHIALIYFAKSKNNHHKLSAEHTGIEWLAVNDLENPKYALTNAIKFYAQEALKAVN